MQFSPTYPALLPVPASISDATLNYAGRYRSRARIPVLTYVHPVNDCSITRCSQPLVGVRGNRSIQDEKLLAAIFNTTRAGRPLSAYNSPPPEREDSGSSKDTALSHMLDKEIQEQPDAEAMEDAVISKLRGDDELSHDWTTDDKRPMVYGAQQRNLIVDARPSINALANHATGMGSEDMSNYKFATKVYLGIDNIHVMRDSLAKVVDALKDSDLTPLGPSRELLQKSEWLKHVGNVLEGVGLIARQVGLQHSHVLIHCSDGWDRTSQLSSLSQLCLDPYYRTVEGFIVLVEKDWLSFGHMFKHRSGFLSSEKWFHIENERISRGSGEDAEGREPGAMSGAGKALENAFLSAKGFFSNSRHNDSRESINVDSDADAGDSESQARRRIVSENAKKERDKMVTKVKETSPIFHQFLDATYQLLYQYPTRFEFTERFLRRLLYHLYSCQYGTFLLDSEKERVEARLSERTKSVWDYFLSRRKEFLNPLYDPTVDDNVRGRERLLFPRTDEVRWWNELFGRTDDEMNAPKRTHANGVSDGETELWTSVGGGSPSAGSAAGSGSVPVSRARTPVLLGVETSEASVGLTAASPRQSASALARARTPVSDSAGSASPKPLDPKPSRIHPVVPREDPLPPDGRPEEAPAPAPREASNETGHESATVEQPAASTGDDTAAHDDEPCTTVSAPVLEDPTERLADDLDPLGIGEAKDHVSDSRRAQTALERRREHMELLMK
jgi:hypothetical protein